MCMLRSSRKFDPLRSCFERASARYGDGCFVHVRQKKRELVTWTLPPCLSFQNRKAFNSDSSDSCMLRSVEILTWSIRFPACFSALDCIMNTFKRGQKRERPLYSANRQYSQAILLRVAREWATTSSRECLRSSSSWPSSVCVWWWKPLTRCSQKRQEMLVSA